MSPLVTIGLSPHSVYASNPELLDLCADVDVPISVHLAETAAETDYCLRGEGPIAQMRSRMGYEPMASGFRPVEVVRKAGLLRRGVCLAHCVHVSDEEIRLIAGSGASVAHCARSNAYLGAGAAPVPRMLEAGTVVGLGTDSAASCLRLDFFEEMRFALGIHRSLAQEAGVLKAKDALTLATVGGARALGLADRIGTLETGKRADMVAVDLRGHPPGADVFVGVVSGGPSDVVMALVDGEEIVREGRPTRVDSAEVQAALGNLMEQQS